jgi:hypothetical protein
VQRIETKLDEHRRVTNMFQQVIEYSVQMKNILLKLSDLEIKNNQIMEEKDRSVQNLHGALEKE